MDQFLRPWVPIAPEFASTFEAQLVSELRPDSPLFGVPCRAIAKRIDRDDVLFEVNLPDAQYAHVDLLWAPPPDDLPGAPLVVLFRDWEDFCSREMGPEHEDWLRWDGPT